MLGSHRAIWMYVTYHCYLHARSRVGMNSSTFSHKSRTCNRVCTFIAPRDFQYRSCGYIISIFIINSTISSSNSHFCARQEDGFPKSFYITDCLASSPVLWTTYPTRKTTDSGVILCDSGILYALGIFIISIIL